MKARYSTNDIRSWADFSGDVNPIHFDATVAADMGLANVPVHGMRVMLDLKTMLYRELVSQRPARHDADWLSFKATLRAPVLRDESYRLAMEGRSAGVNFTLSDDASAAICMTGHLRPARSQPAAVGIAPAGENRQAPQQFVIPTRSLLDALPAFQSMALNADYLWLLIDALLFRHLIESRDWPFRQVSQELGMVDAETANELMRHTRVLQTHHMMTLSPRAQQLTPEDLLADPAVQAIQCEIEPPLTTGGPTDGYVTQVSLTASLKGAPLMTTTVGLMIFPLNSSVKTKELDDVHAKGSV